MSLKRSATAHGSQNSPTAALLTWVQQSTEGYEGVKVSNFTTSFADGLAFCAIAHNAWPDKIDFKSLSKANAKQNMQLAFDVFKEMGVEPLLDAEDIVDHQEQKSIITYLLMVHRKVRPSQNLINLGPAGPKGNRPKSAMPLPRYNTAPMKALQGGDKSTPSAALSVRTQSEALPAHNEESDGGQSPPPQATPEAKRPVKTVKQIQRASDHLRVLQRTNSLPALGKHTPGASADASGDEKPTERPVSPRITVVPPSATSAGSSKPEIPKTPKKEGRESPKKETPKESAPSKDTNPKKSPSVKEKGKSKDVEEIPASPIPMVDVSLVSPPVPSKEPLTNTKGTKETKATESLAPSNQDFPVEPVVKRDRAAVLGGWGGSSDKSKSAPAPEKSGDSVTGLFSPETVIVEDMAKYDAIYKIIVIGDTATGKTSLLNRWLTDRYDPSNPPTVGTEFSTKTYRCNNKVVKIQLWDTAGQERYRAVTRQYYRGALGAIVVYDISRKDSYQSIKNWLEELKDYNPDVVNMQILLVGNKSDLDGIREVPQKEALAFAKQEGLHFLETSAKEGANVLRAFQLIMQDIHQVQSQKGGNQLDGDGTPNPALATRKAVVIALDQQSSGAAKKDEGGCAC